MSRNVPMSMVIPLGVGASRQIEPYRDSGAGDYRDIITAVVRDVQAALDGSHRHLPVRQAGLHRGRIDLVGPLHADGDLHLHRLRVETEGTDQAQGRMMERILHRAERSLGVIPSVQIVAGAELQYDPFECHVFAPYAISRRTIAAA